MIRYGEAIWYGRLNVRSGFYHFDSSIIVTKNIPQKNLPSRNKI